MKVDLLGRREIEHVRSPILRFSMGKGFASRRCGCVTVAPSIGPLARSSQVSGVIRGISQLRVAQSQVHGGYERRIWPHKVSHIPDPHTSLSTSGHKQWRSTGRLTTWLCSCELLIFWVHLKLGNGGKWSKRRGTGSLGKQQPIIVQRR